MMHALSIAGALVIVLAAFYVADGGPLSRARILLVMLGTALAIVALGWAAS